MSPLLFRRIVWSVAPLGLFLGCSKPSAQVSAQGRPDVVNTKELPGLGDYLPPLDRDRIEVAPPEGWHLPPRSSKYVVRVQKSAGVTYPTIIITAEDYDGEGISNVSDDNVEQFAARIAAAANKDRSAVRPVRIGEFVGVTYPKRGRVRTPVTMILELICMETVVAGRKYHIELRSEDGSLENDQPYLFALVGGIRFLQRGREEPGEATEEGARAEPQKPGKPKGEATEKPKSEAKGKAKPEAKKEAQKPSKKSDDLELDLDQLEELLKE